MQIKYEKVYVYDGKGIPIHCIEIDKPKDQLTHQTQTKRKGTKDKKLTKIY